jgi:endonuclease/exonuclease/phosphatase family metal-dependent hydrolase
VSFKILQLNIFQGKYLDRVIDFVKKEDIDILHLQEITAGKLSQGGTYHYPGNFLKRKLNIKKKFIKINCFEEIKKNLKMDGILVATSKLKGDSESYFGNATFFKKNIKLLSNKIVWLKDFLEIDESFTDIPNLSRAAIIAKFKIGRTKTLTTINSHFAWGPNPLDEPYKINQARKLYNAIKTSPDPFVFTGDFNVTPETNSASMFDGIGRNLVKEFGVKNTLNKRVHPAKVLFPRGIAVDYIFVSEDIEVKKFEVIDKIDLSDHYGLLLGFRF